MSMYKLFYEPPGRNKILTCDDIKILRDLVKVDLFRRTIYCGISIKNYIEQFKNETSFLEARLLQKLGLNSLYFWIKLKINVLYWCCEWQLHKKI
ncbi:uncharacterized protein OCT59_011282 [Rhizophagus irregularis]|uniref:uncharacterized protein n=1 Tax=Rhizophagus irregularis TaxID=588596 RepID=UPI003330617C|nr:hypothetical protein OCT59_011282 [Rhizophagus irregularis]